MRKEDIKTGQCITLTEEIETYYPNEYFNLKAGMRGKIIDYSSPYDALIEFDDFIYGHDGDGKGKNGHCWLLSKEVLIKIAKVCKRKNNY